MATWMIYGANGYTGELPAREAVARGLTPVLAGGSAPVGALAMELGLEARIFGLDETASIATHLSDMTVVLHCAGPFEVTSAPMIEGCLQARTHYLDITGEISVFEHARSLHQRALDAGIVVCPGAGFDVIPTDCVAAALAEALPDATHLRLGFDTGSTLSPGTTKTLVTQMADGGKARVDGRIVAVPQAWRTRRIDFGDGEKLAMAIPWGDVSSAHHTTGIPNIEVYAARPRAAVIAAKVANYLGWLLARSAVQRLLHRLIEFTIKGPDSAARDGHPTYVWGEVENAAAVRRTARIKTANGYSLTISGGLAIVAHILDQPANTTGGYYTPSTLVDADLVTRLAGSGPLNIR